MDIGFTGTREGMTGTQKQQLFDWLAHYSDVQTVEPLHTFHHGDCQGSDAEAHHIAFLLRYIIHVHPPDNSQWRAYCCGPSRVIRHAPLPYLQRNHAIVEACHVLLATPKSAKEVPRSGTWATIRHARTIGKPVHILT